MTSVKPLFGINYNIGDIGFIFVDNEITSIGIAWFTDWEKGKNPDVPQIPVSHVVIVTGEDECVEALPLKVRKSTLSKYFNNTHAHISFRRPVNLMDDVVKDIVNDAYSTIGGLYNIFLIIGHFLSDNWFGRLLYKWTEGKSKIFFTKLFYIRNTWNCSQLVGYCLNNRPQYKGQGVLVNDLYSLDPQEVFQDRIIFVPWKKESYTLWLKCALKKRKL